MTEDLDDFFDLAAGRRLFAKHQASFDAWIDNAINRMGVLQRKCPYCPRCGTRQVQIIQKDAPAQWKCRSCKRKFEYEPS